MSPSWITVSRVERTPSPRRSIQAIRALVCVWNVTLLRPTQASGAGTWSTRIVPEGSRKSGSAPAGSSRRRTWSAVHFTVATVVIPSRW